MFELQALVFIFLIRLRFPRNSSISDILRRRYGLPVLKLYRSTERLDYKVRKLQCDIDFLTSCSQQDLIPNFLRFKLYTRVLHHSRLYRNCQRQFLNREIKSKKRTLWLLNDRLKCLVTQLKEAVSWLDIHHLLCLIERTNCNTISRVKFVQNDKLKKLGFITNDGVSHNDVLFNYSNRILSDLEKKVLARGLKYAIANCKLNFIDHFCSFEVFFKHLKAHDFYDRNNKGLGFFRSSLKHLAFTSFYNPNNSNFVHNLTKEEYNCLLNLAKDKSIIIVKPDKGNGVVLMNKEEYVEKMLQILNDHQKFERVHDDVLLTILNKEEKINRFLRRLKADGVLNDSVYKMLFASGSKPGILYGLPKVHKEDYPLRPIMSAIGTFNYKLSKFLVPALAAITTSQYTVRDSFTFAKEICDLKYGRCVMASFDVKSLFTNVPLSETINICIDNLFRNVDRIQNFSKQQLHKLLSLSCTDCYFIFNEKVYTQKDGVAMGNPLGPTLANAFLSHYEVKWLDECPVHFKPLLYRRYVDDTFLIFKSQDHVPLFLDYLNSKHPNIEFTSESEISGKLPFLDILVSRENDDTFSTSVYRKPTFTGLTTKFSSFIPVDYKRNLILTLATRAFNICSSYLSIHTEFLFIKRTLYLNGFNGLFCESYIGKQLQRLLHPPSKKITVDRAVMYFPLTFTGNSSFSLRNKLTKLLREFYPQVLVRVIFKPKYTIQNLFKFKDVVPQELQSSIIYQYECNCCRALYIGQSKRQFKVRLFEHWGKSIRTNRPLGKPPFSSIRQHSHDCDHPMDSSSFSILSSRPSVMELPIAESLYIKQKKPSLCSQETSVDLLCF